MGVPLVIVVLLWFFHVLGWSADPRAGCKAAWRPRGGRGARG